MLVSRYVGKYSGILVKHTAGGVCVSCPCMQTASCVDVCMCSHVRRCVRACVRACVRVCVSACVACLWSKRSMRATKMPGMTMSPRPSIEKGMGDTPRAWGGGRGEEALGVWVSA